MVSVHSVHVHLTSPVFAHNAHCPPTLSLCYTSCCASNCSTVRYQHTLHYCKVCNALRCTVEMSWKSALLAIFAGVSACRVKQRPDASPFEKSFGKVKTSANGPWSAKQGNFGAYAILGRRNSMEDRFSFMDNGERGENLYWAFAVFDGHRGSFFCDYAEEHLLEAITRQIFSDPAPPSLDISQILIREFNNLDQRGISAGGGASGSTAIVGIRLGDSRALAKKNESDEIIETRDHKANVTEEEERIKSAGGFVINGRLGGILAVSRAFGDADLKTRGLIATPDVYDIDLEQEPLDYIVLASDGLWDKFSSREAIEFVGSRKKKAFFGAKELAKEALKRGSMDNICVMIVHFRDITSSLGVLKLLKGNLRHG